MTMRVALLASIAAMAACATSGEGSYAEDDAGFGGAASGAMAQSGQGGFSSASTSGGGTCAAGQMQCKGACIDPLSTWLHCGGCDQQCPADYACVQGQCQSGGSNGAQTGSGTSVASSGPSTSVSASTSVASSTNVATAASSTGSGMMNCDPLNPGIGCGSGFHCVPQQSGMPLCAGPTGLGGQYDSCASSAQCGPPFECVQTPYLTVYCMKWCKSDFDCIGALDACTYFSPGLYIGGVQYGVCYDGYP
ncbi:MAG: hypothetical protein EXR75_12050 [Myxococcales bacterium]|nr:hypothetical protein [Myxococcales bacterium]